MNLVEFIPQAKLYEKPIDTGNPDLDKKLRLINAVLGISTELNELRSEVYLFEQELRRGTKESQVNQFFKCLAEIGDAFWFSSIAIDAMGWNAKMMEINFTDSPFFWQSNYFSRLYGHTIGSELERATLLSNEIHDVVKSYVFYGSDTVKNRWYGDGNERLRVSAILEYMVTGILCYLRNEYYELIDGYKMAEYPSEIPVTPISFPDNFYTLVLNKLDARYPDKKFNKTHTENRDFEQEMLGIQRV